MLPVAMMCSPMPMLVMCFCHRFQLPATHRHCFPLNWFSDNAWYNALADTATFAPPRAHLKTAHSNESNAWMLPTGSFSVADVHFCMKRFKAMI